MSAGQSSGRNWSQIASSFSGSSDALTKTTLEHLLSSFSIISVDSLKARTDQDLFAHQAANDPRTAHDAEICIFTELFGLKMFVTSLNVSSEMYHSCFKSVDYEGEVDSIRLREDGLIVQFADESMLMLSVDPRLNEHGQIIDFDLRTKLTMKRSNLQIFENICLFTQNEQLILNSFISEGGTVRLTREGAFDIKSLLVSDHIVSESDRSPIIMDQLESEPKPSLPQALVSESTGSEFDTLFHAFFLKGCFGVTSDSVYVLCILVQPPSLHLFRYFQGSLYRTFVCTSAIRSFDVRLEVAHFSAIRRFYFEKMSKIILENFDKASFKRLLRKKTQITRSGTGIWLNCPLFESLAVLPSAWSGQVSVLAYDRLLPMRKVLRHPKLEPKTFSICPINDSSSKSRTSLLLFFDPARIPQAIDHFLAQLSLRRDDVGRPRLRDNPFGVKQVLYFDRRFVCIFRDHIESGQRRPSQFVDVVDLTTQQAVFQERSSESQTITHVKIFKIPRTKETQLFVGTSNSSAERDSQGEWKGHSQAEWKIYRIIQRKNQLQE